MKTQMLTPDAAGRAASTRPAEKALPNAGAEARLCLILLPGMDGTGELFAPLIHALAGAFMVKAVAYPPTQPLGYDQLEVIARAAIPEDGDYVILGESFSGPLAIALAADPSPRLKAVVLCCTFTRNPLPALSGLKGLLRFLPFGWATPAVAGHFLFGGFSTVALRAALAQALGRIPSVVLRQRLRAVLTVDASSKLAKVSVPVLYLRAARDRLVPRSASVVVALACPQTHIVQIEGPHCLLQVAPVEAAQEIVAFIRGVVKALET